MSTSRLFVYTGITITAFVALGSTLYVSKSREISRRKQLRKKLPNGIHDWRRPDLLPTPIGCEELWGYLLDLFREVGLVPWIHLHGCEVISPSPGSIVSANGYCYVPPGRGLEGRGPGAAKWMGVFGYMNPLTRAAQTPDGQAVVVKVLAIRDEGHECLNIIRKTSTGPLALLSNNHCLPLIKEFAFEDIIFGVFPKTGGLFEEAWHSWTRNSVGDILDMLLQILEGVTFLHELNIVHRDLFFTNFLVDWHPESLRSKEVAVSKPRVHIIDFEFAVQFPDDSPPEARVCTGIPFPRWYPNGGYSRPYPRELRSNKPYCPFKLDVWQLGYTFTRCGFKTTVPDIDALFLKMRSKNPIDRPTAREALTQLHNMVNSRPPESLLIPPIVDKR